MGSNEDERVKRIEQFLHRDLPTLLGVSPESVRMEPVKLWEEPDPPRPTDKHGRELRAGDLLRCGTSVQRIRGDWTRNASEFMARVDGGCWVWTSPSTGRFEVLQRGYPSDPVPASFTPERDAEGRPVLDGEAAGPVHFCGPSGLPWCEPDPARGGSRPFVGSTPFDIRDVTCESCRDAIRNDKNAPKGFDPWKPAEDEKPFFGVVYAEPSLPSRYAAFRATVERVVAEEAPRARVVTDHYDMGGAEKFIAFVTLPVVGERVIRCETDWHDYAPFVRGTVRMYIQDAGQMLGAVAMGGKR